MPPKRNPILGYLHSTMSICVHRVMYIDFERHTRGKSALSLCFSPLSCGLGVSSVGTCRYQYGEECQLLYYPNEVLKLPRVSRPRRNQ